MSVKKLFSIFAMFFIITSPIFSQTKSSKNQIEIVLFVPDTLVATGQNSGLLNIYIDNFNIEIFGFQFVLKSNRPDLVTFDISGVGYDATGTLVENFEYIEAIDKAGDQSEFWFRCIADIFGGGQVKQDGILPQQGGIAIKVPFITTNAPDTTLSFRSDFTIEIPTDFSDPFGISIGVIPDTVVDTTYYNCTLWVNSICSASVEVLDTSLGYDFVSYDSIVVGLLDPNIVQVIEGAITLDILNCDLDGNGDIDISDLVCLVNYMFQPQTPFPCSLLYCDTDLNGQLDISDLVFLVAFMFNSGPPPPDL